MPSSRIRYQTSREAYEDRNETLRLLGFKSNASYLKSRLWEIVRERALEIKGRFCKRCGQEATQVHHALYTREVLIGEDVRGLVPICGRCHRQTSTTGRGSKAKRIDLLKVRHLGDTNSLLFRFRPKSPQRVKGGDFFCECGRRRKERRSRCGVCLRAAGIQTHRPKLTLEQIRELSARYAEGKA